MANLPGESPYRIFREYFTGEWYIAAKKVGDEITVLYDGDDHDECYLSILKDLGVAARVARVQMRGECCYKPTAKDWKKVK